MLQYLKSQQEIEGKIFPNKRKLSKNKGVYKIFLQKVILEKKTHSGDQLILLKDWNKLTFNIILKDKLL